MTFLVGYHPPRRIPSSKAFLFTLKPYNASHGPMKFNVSPAKREKATRGDQSTGPCWGYGNQEMGFTAQNVKINPGGTFDYGSIVNPGLLYTGQVHFQADDLEVFTISGMTRKYSYSWLQYKRVS